MPGHSLLSVSVSCGSRSPDRDRHPEWHEMKPSTDGFVDNAEVWLVFAGDDEPEGGPVLEKVLAHEARSDRVAASKLFYAGLGPSSALFSFRRRDETRAAKPSQISRVTDQAGAPCTDERARLVGAPANGATRFCEKPRRAQGQPSFRRLQLLNSAAHPLNHTKGIRVRTDVTARRRLVKNRSIDGFPGKTLKLPQSRHRSL
jgi:hypothetical protein